MTELEKEKQKYRAFAFQGLLEFKQNDESEILIEVDFNERNLFNIVSGIKSISGETQKIVLLNKVNFKNKIFDSEIDLSYCTFKKGISFINCTFKEDVFLKYCFFKKVFDLSESTFEKKCRFHFSEFKVSASFRNTTFNSLVDFYSVEFKKTQQFFLTDFLNITIFSNSIFEKQIQFLYNKISDKTFISFENAEFQQSLDISRSNFWCNIQVWGVETKIIPDEVWLYETDDINKCSNQRTRKSLKRLRESYRRIKQEFRKDDNNIEALKFHKYEMKLFNVELKNSDKKKWQDRFILFFNK